MRAMRTMTDIKVADLAPARLKRVVYRHALVTRLTHWINRSASSC